MADPVARCLPLPLPDPGSLPILYRQRASRATWRAVIPRRIFGDMELGGEPIKRRRGEFKKLHRLRDTTDFRRVLRRRCMEADAAMVIYVDRNGLRWTRIGLSISRRVGCAAVRNRAKRVAREAFRLSRDELPVGIDVVCVLKTSEPVTLDRFRAALSKLVQAAAAKLERQAC